MNRFKRYYSALHRYKRSKGYGIHSPFAFNFVLRVLREQCPYYAYDDIHYRRHRAKKLAAKIFRKPHIISYSNAKMLFRITCFFSPETILQIGTSYGISTSAMLDVSSNSHLIIYPGNNSHEDIYRNITEPYRARISAFRTIEKALCGYRETNTGKPHFILINDLTNDDAESLFPTLQEALDNNGVVIMRNLSKRKNVLTLWDKLCREMTFGMSFSNGRIGIIVSRSHLPLQHFSLWF
ncbi:MAG: hypothetical protein IJY31_05260 [Muribaculaceae bacterium]|nr:hypothetical protein [Muribaculaceae bacterium]